MKMVVFPFLNDPSEMKESIPKINQLVNGLDRQYLIDLAKSIKMVIKNSRAFLEIF